MITKWTIKNFKSVSQKTDLKFEPLTIFAGANSSGKSTIIQSLLLTAQTIQNSVTSRSVILNGHISKFGNFNDILSHNEKDKKEIEIGFSLIPRKNHLDNEFLSRRFMLPYDEEINKVDLQFSFSADSNQVEQLNPTLNSVSIQSELNEKIKQKINIKKSPKSFEERKNEFKINSLSNIDKQSMEFEVEISPKSRTAGRYYRIPNEVKFIGVNLLHFLPYSITGVYNELDTEISYILKTLEGKIPYIDFDNIEHVDIILNDEFKALILNIFLELVENTNNVDDIHNQRIIESFNSSLKALKSDFTLKNLKRCLSNRYFQRTIATLFEDRKTEIEKIFNKIRSDQYIKVRTLPLHLPEVDYIENYFKRNLKYLGPLRDEPKAIYPLEGYADSTDVGFKGENTAAVLEVHKNTIVTYIPSSEFDKNIENKETRKDTLQNAVLDWLIYLGVATNYKTSDKGKLGHELTVSTDASNNFQDLTHVGVGVSQVLPILVLSLLANSDSTLIFEQPELHLHPKVQTRLADFFISLNILDKQCLVETHSEYLINRLRYLVATSKGETLSNNSILYFVEKENSLSTYNEIRINKYGVIRDWPKGFFDESEKLASKMLEAAMLKRKKEKVY
jgi:predicted ATPase